MERNNVSPVTLKPLYKAKSINLKVGHSGQTFRKNWTFIDSIQK